MTVPSSVVLDTGQFTCSLQLIGPRPIYRIEADTGHLVFFRWQGTKLAAGLKALAAEINNLAENVDLAENDEIPDTGIRPRVS